MWWWMSLGLVGLGLAVLVGVLVVSAALEHAQRQSQAGPPTRKGGPDA